MKDINETLKKAHEHNLVFFDCVSKIDDENIFCSLVAVHEFYKEISNAILKEIEQIRGVENGLTLNDMLPFLNMCRNSLRSKNDNEHS